MVTRLEAGDPARIGRYRLLGQLGAGGMGRVLLGVGPDGRLVAIKQVHAHLVGEQDFLPRFRREAQTSARVSGAYTAAVVDFDVESESPWLASVFVPGMPLDRAVQQYGTLGPGQIRTLAVGLASALRSIHGVGLIHRDLKPGNVILAQDGPRVIDFGIARVADELSDLTHTGSIIGSPAFMSPEQAQSEPLTPAGDVFSLGSVLVMAATGASPFAGNSMPHVLYKIVNTDPDLSVLSPEVRELVGPCLNRDPAARPTPAQILDFLGSLPPQQQPWPLGVHRAIYDQSRELSALVSDPEATQITGIDTSTVPEPPGADFDRRVGQFLLAAQVAETRRRRRLLTGALVGVVILVGAVVGGVFAFGGSDGRASAGPNPLAGLNLTALRSMDMCAVMRDPLIPSLGRWTRSPVSERWGRCSAQAGGYEFDLDIQRTTAYRNGGRTVNGVPVLETDRPVDGGCGRALIPATMDPQFGITLTVKNGPSVDQRCTVADDALGRLAPDVERGPRLADIRNSLAHHDPCALVDPDDTHLSIGDKVRGTPDLLHSCDWIGTNTLTVTFERTKAFASPAHPIHIDFGGGNVIDVDAAEMNSNGCVRRGVYRTVTGDDVEAVTVRVTTPTVGTGTVPAGKCLSAQTILNHVLGDLPEVMG
ncbi:serine/threonine-protein kinase [Nocardia miyunensis]|uniref:serine/threonine-protein kinase n=1 Tax=Nocardia miyunensis TaxID=282684 RepID=UPI0008375064|nr:serine/threonine-protein kinase [Nocardia miyunensis]